MLKWSDYSSLSKQYASLCTHLLDIYKFARILTLENGFLTLTTMNVVYVQGYQIWLEVQQPDLGSTLTWLCLVIWMMLVKSTTRVVDLYLTGNTY